MLFGRDMGLHSVILEGYALKVAQAFQNEDSLWQRYDNLIEDSNVILSNLESWSVVHTRR